MLTINDQVVAHSRPVFLVITTRFFLGSLGVSQRISNFGLTGPALGTILGLFRLSTAFMELVLVLVVTVARLSSVYMDRVPQRPRLLPHGRRGRRHARPGLPMSTTRRPLPTALPSPGSSCEATVPGWNIGADGDTGITTGAGQLIPILLVLLRDRLALVVPVATRDTLRFGMS